jgi:hypothetical protein
VDRERVPLAVGAVTVIWWLLGMPVLWLRRLLCRAGLHSVEDYGVTGYGEHCLRCYERIY